MPEAEIKLDFRRQYYESVLVSPYPDQERNKLQRPNSE